MCFYDGLNQREISEKLDMSQMQVSRKMKKDEEFLPRPFSLRLQRRLDMRLSTV